MRVRRSIGVVIALLALTVAAVAQQQRTYIVAVAVDSTDGRIQQWAPELRKQAAEVAQKVARNVRTILVTGSKAEMAEQAQKNNADYLLRIEIAPRPFVSVETGPPRQGPESLGIPSGATTPENIYVAWTIEPFKGNKLTLHDSRYVRKSEYPLTGLGTVLGKEFNALHDIASRSVRDAAAAAVGKLKKKKGLQP